MRNINKKCVVQNAENKKDVILKKAKNEEKSSMFGITVEQLVSTYDFSHEKYESTLAEDIISLCQEKGIYPCLKYKSLILLEQIRIIDKTRLRECIGKLTSEEIERLDTAVAASLNLDL